MWGRHVDGFFLNYASGYGVYWWMDLTPTASAPDITANLRTILRGILAVLGMWRITPSTALLVHRRIGATFARIEKLLSRFRAGRLWTRTRRVQVRQTGAKAGRGSALPRRFGWLVIAGGHQAAGFGAQLQTVLSTTEMVALLAASAQARRILRPVCRALAVTLPWTVTPPRPPKPRKPRAPCPKPEPFKIPLPRGVLTWARREMALEHAKRRLGLA